MPANQHIRALLEMSRQTLLSCVDGVPAEKACAQLPGASNHVLWTLGHLAVSYQFFGPAGGAKVTAVPSTWEKLFGMGSAPVADPAVYPPLAEVRAAYEKVQGEVSAFVAGLGDADLDGKPVSDGGGMFRSRADCFLMAAWHDGWHAGQLAALRRGLGLKPLFS